MRNIFVLYLFILIGLISSCDDSVDSWTGELPIKEYNLEEGEEGSFQRDIYNFYDKYGSIILTNVDSSDYRYNFGSINELTITNAEDNEADYKNAYTIFKEVFLDIYSDKFLKENLCFNIIFCEEIKAKVQYSISNVDFFIGSNFIAISGVNSSLKNISAEDKKSLKNSINVDFWKKIMFEYKHRLGINNEFYNISGKYYSENRGWFDPPFTDEEVYDRGFISSIWHSAFHEQRKDAGIFIEYVLLNDEATMLEKFNEYPLVKKKYYFIKNAISNNFDIDTDTLLQ